jgi:hypothetical protein
LEDQIAQLKAKMKQSSSSNNIPSLRKSITDIGDYLVPEYNAYKENDGLWQPIIHMGG